MQFADLPDDAVPAVIATEAVLHRASSLVISVPVVYVYAHGFVVHIEVFHPDIPDRERRRTVLKGHRISCAIGDDVIAVPMDGSLTAFERPWPGYCWPLSSASRHTALRLWIAHLPQAGSVSLAHTSEPTASAAGQGVIISSDEMTAAATRSWAVAYLDPPTSAG